MHTLSFLKIFKLPSQCPDKWSSWWSNSCDSYIFMFGNVGTLFYRTVIVLSIIKVGLFVCLIVQSLTVNNSLHFKWGCVHNSLIQMSSYREACNVIVLSDTIRLLRGSYHYFYLQWSKQINLLSFKWWNTEEKYCSIISS